MNKHNLVVGQTVWITKRAHYGSAWPDLIPTKVEKVGRIWAQIDETRDRLNVETLQMESSGRRVWLRPELYEQAKTCDEAWTKFCVDIQNIRYRRPQYITLEAIKEARRKLGI